MNHRVDANPIRFHFTTSSPSVTVRKEGVPRRIVKLVFEREPPSSKGELYRFYQRNVEQATDKEELDAALRYYVHHRLWEVDEPD